MQDIQKKAVVAAIKQLRADLYCGRGKNYSPDATEAEIETAFAAVKAGRTLAQACAKIVKQ